MAVTIAPIRRGAVVAGGRMGGWDRCGYSFDVTVVSIVLAVVALAVAVLALRRADVVERRAKEWLAEADRPARPAATAPGDVADVELRLARLEAAGATSGISRVGVVRYDAFEDLGGRMSFSAALVDESGRGIVLTAIHGRGETRSYLKQVPVTSSSGQRDLSPEEDQAVAQALRGTP